MAVSAATAAKMVVLLFMVDRGLGFQAFRPGEPWLDTEGHVIDAHGGGMLEDVLEDGTSKFFWYGSKRNHFKCCHDGGVNLYSSTDLYEWSFEGTILRAFNGSTTGNGLDLERPKVIRCAATGKYVMWVRGTGEGNTPQLLAVATSDKPTGPFKFEGNTTDPFHTVYPGNPNLPDGYQYADATLFEDPRLRGRDHYVYWRTRVNPQQTGFRALKLTDDCTGIRPESDSQLFQTPNREAPAAFFYDEYNGSAPYYLWTSGTDGWRPCTMHLYTAASPLGDFNRSGLNNSQGWLIGWQPTPIPPPEAPGNRKTDGQPGEWAFGSQSTYILRNPRYIKGSRLPQFIYMADRWTPSLDEKGLFGTYVWLPLFIDPKNSSRVRVVWHDAWRLDNVTSPFISSSLYGASVSSL